MLVCTAILLFVSLGQTYGHGKNSQVLGRSTLKHSPSSILQGKCTTQLDGTTSWATASHSAPSQIPTYCSDLRARTTRNPRGPSARGRRRATPRSAASAGARFTKKENPFEIWLEKSPELRLRIPCAVAVSYSDTLIKISQ